MIINTFPTKKKSLKHHNFWANYLLDSLTANEKKHTHEFLKVEFLKFFSEFVHLYCHHWEIS